jgi:hypothetical protein
MRRWFLNSIRPIERLSREPNFNAWEIWRWSLKYLRWNDPCDAGACASQSDLPRLELLSPFAQGRVSPQERVGTHIQHAAPPPQDPVAPGFNCS